MNPRPTSDFNSGHDHGVRPAGSDLPRPRWQRIRVRLLAWADLGLAILLLIFVNAIAARMVHRLTPGRGASTGLSESSRAVLGQLQEPLTLTLFATREAAGYDEWDFLLRDYEAASRHVRTARVDPGRDLEEARALVRRHRLDKTNVITLELGSRGAVVDLEIGEQEAGRTPWLDRSAVVRQWGERMLTSAMLGLIQTRMPVVAFAAGEGEGDPDQFGPLGYSRWARELRRQAIHVGKIVLAEGIPDGVDLLVILAPSHPLSEPAKAAFRRFWDRGGRILLLLEPEGVEGIAELLAEQGVRLVSEEQEPPPANEDESERRGWIVARPTEHPMTRGIQDRVCLLHGPLGIEATLRESTTNRFRVRPLLVAEHRTGRDPVRTLGVVLEALDGMAASDTPTSRMVVIGDADWATNARWGGGSADILSALVNGLLQREVLLGVPPRLRSVVRIGGGPRTCWRLFGAAVCGLTAGWLLLAMAVRMVRRG